MNGLRALGIVLGTAGLLSLGAGCAKQAEGERCDLASSGNADCDGDLTCFAQTSLHDADVDRCCPADGTSTHVNCQLATEGQFGSGGTGSGGTGSGGTGTGGTGTGGTDAGGTGTGGTDAGGTGTGGTGTGGTDAGGTDAGGTGG